MPFCFGTTRALRKPARKQGRNSQLERIALAYARACAIAARQFAELTSKMLISDFDYELPPALIAQQPVHAYEYEGVRYDCGSKLGYLQATVDLGLEHDDLGGDFEGWLREKFGK